MDHEPENRTSGATLLIPGMAGGAERAFVTVRQGAAAHMKVRHIISLIERDGWYRIDAKGGHRQYKHLSKKGRVTISGNANDDVHPKTLSSIFKQAGLKCDL